MSEWMLAGLRLTPSAWNSGDAQVPLHPPPCRSITAPTASWTDSTLAAVSPASLTIPAAAWATPQLLAVQPSADLVDGDYFISLQFT